MTSALGTTITSNVVGFGAATQPSDMHGGSQMAAVSHVMGNMETYVTPQVRMVSEEALPLPTVQASEAMAPTSSRNLRRGFRGSRYTCPC